MLSQPTKLSRTMLCGGTILLLAGMMVLAGCSSDDGGPPDPPPTMDPAQGMERIERIAGDVMPEDGIEIDDETIAALMAMMADMGFELPANGELPDIPPVGDIDMIIFGLHVRGSWNLDAEALNLTSNLRITGTVADTDSELDGSTVDLTAAVNIAGGNGTVTLNGTVAEPGGAPKLVAFKATISDAGSDKRVRIEAKVTERGVELFFCDVTAVFDPFGDDDSGLLNGTVRIVDPENAPHRISLTLTDVRTDAEGELASGRVVMYDSMSALTATLGVQPDGSLAGPVTDNRGAVVGHMTVVDGQPTVTPV